jgi:hypothetical protein
MGVGGGIDLMGDRAELCMRKPGTRVAVGCGCGCGSAGSVRGARATRNPALDRRRSAVGDGREHVDWLTASTVVAYQTPVHPAPASAMPESQPNRPRLTRLHFQAVGYRASFGSRHSSWSVT